jgi:hypothetical protein
MALSQGAPRRRRVDRRLPALSSLRGHRPAQERRCEAVANLPMSVPISELDAVGDQLLRARLHHLAPAFSILVASAATGIRRPDPGLFQASSLRDRPRHPVERNHAHHPSFGAGVGSRFCSAVSARCFACSRHSSRSRERANENRPRGAVSRRGVAFRRPPSAPFPRTRTGEFGVASGEKESPHVYALGGTHPEEN